MPAPDRAEEIRNAFLDVLRAEDLSPEPIVQAARSSSGQIRQLFAALGLAGREVYLIRGVALINLHIRSEPPGWWNILKTVKRDLDAMAKEFRVNCIYVLLIGRNDRHVADGYIATDFDKPPFLKAPKGEKTKYSIREGQHLDKRALLLSVAKVAKVLASHRIVKEDEHERARRH